MRSQPTVIIALIASAIAFGSCGGASRSAADTPAASPTTGASATPRPPPGLLLVYSKHVRDVDTAGRRFPVLSIVSYSVDSGREVSSFDVGGAGEYPAQTVLAGDRIVVNYERRITSYALDGSDERELRRAPGGDGNGFIGIDASPDGTKIALTEQHAPICGTPDAQDRTFCDSYADRTRVVAIDAADGRELLSVPQSDPALAGYVGQAAIITWRADGRGFVVQAYTYSEYPGGLATVMLDGSVRQDAYTGWPYIAPNGRYVADGALEPCSLSLATERHELLLRDLDNGAVLGAVREPVLNIEATMWSPDSTEMLYKTYSLEPEPSQPPCKRAVAGTETWHTVRLDGSPPEVQADAFSSVRRWGGGRSIEFRCNGQPVLYADCMDITGGHVPLQITLNGRFIDSAVDFRALGFVGK